MSHTKNKAFPASWTRSQVSLGFTLVELIVVVTILAILATIGFVSYSSYLTGVRDTNRLAQLVSIHDGLELYRTRNDLPLPDDNVEVRANGTTIAYQ
jgi:prepilin-type N-terminal cleavage/methylation domain-containing protein